MKVLAFFSLFIPLISFATGVESLDIRNLGGQYAGGSGNAQATYWELPNAPGVSNANFSVLKEQDSFVFTGDAGQFTIEKLPDILLKMRNLDWNNANAKTNSKSIKVSLTSLKGSSSTQNVTLRGLSLDCQGSTNLNSARDAAIANCINRARVNNTFLELVDTGRSSSWMRKFFTSVLTNEAASKTGIEKLEFAMNSGSFNLKLKAKLDISANIKAEGSMELQRVSGKSELRIRLKKVKASFLNVTKKVFEALEDNPVDGVRVERPFVIIELDS